MREIDYYDLGATLYMSVLHHNIDAILSRQKYPMLRSVVICLEDALPQKDFLRGMERLCEIIKKFEVSDLKVFVRPRNIENFQMILTIEGIEKIDGFALAKFGTENISEYLGIAIEHNHFYLMPILETKDVFSGVSLTKIMMELNPFRSRVLTVRIGLEDILSHLTLMRPCDKTIYDVMPVYIVISTIFNLFKSNGFSLSSPVYGCYENLAVFERELQGDTNHQVFNKTIIHPNQIVPTHKSYQIDEDSYLVATRLIESSEAVFGYKGRMYEKNTHTPWAKTILKRYEYYGMKPKESDA